jgi:hypothetical protein
MIPMRTVPCTDCGTPTTMLGTKLCDGCWELRRRVESNPEMARRILGLSGGQGRSAHDVEQDALGFAGVVALLVVVLVLLALTYLVTR